MTDFAMCPSHTCLVRTVCRRNPESGTVPCAIRQSWCSFTPPGSTRACSYFDMIDPSTLPPAPRKPPRTDQ